MLDKQIIFDYWVEAGGDMRIGTSQKKETRVGLENPRNANEALGVVEIKNGSICGSAGNRRSWGKWHHIINPEKMASPKEIEAVWVVASRAIVADALTTALFLVPAEKFKGSFEFEYLILKDDFSVEKSDGFRAELFG